VSAEGPHNVNDHGSTEPEGLLTTIAHTMATPGNNNIYLGGEMVLVLGVEHAHLIARRGWSKRDVAEFLFREAVLPPHFISEENRRRYRRFRPDVFGQEELGNVPVMSAPEDIVVLVAGGPGKHSLVIPTFGSSRSVTVEIASL